ncbi:MAG TPA: PIG-L family deacetylase [Gemmatimonadaceae bacterium]
MGNAPVCILISMLNTDPLSAAVLSTARKLAPLVLAMLPHAQISAQSRSVVRQLSNPSGVDVVVVAHADDWQVFMGDAVVERVKSGRRPVFIYLTAGDHGRDSVYWQQREYAALQSTRVALGAAPETIARCDTAQVAAHAIARCTLGLSVSYFLRLPDGNRNGAGFRRNRFESLRKLRTDRIAAITTVDGSTRYTDWQDLRVTVGALVGQATDSSSAVEMVLHTTDPSVRINPHDHYDHRMAGKLVEGLLRANGWSGRYYIGYALATRAPNRTSVQRQEKLIVFSEYDREMMRMNHSWSAYREHPEFYSECMQRTYARSVRSASVATHR